MNKLAEIERSLSRPLDPEKELWQASRKRFVYDRSAGLVLPVYHDPLKASFVTGTSSELIYANTTAGTAKNTFTTEAVINDVAGMGAQPILPLFFWLPGRGPGVSFRVVARGIYSTTAAPTWQFFARLGSAASTAGPNIGSTAATALGSGQTNLLWEYEADMTLTIQGGTGANSTIRGLGLFTAQLTTSTAVPLAIFGGGASPGTVATVDISITNFLNFTAACGTSNVSNSVQLLQLLLFGLN